MSVDTAVINCPVCQYQNIKGDICPNCDTEIALIRALTELKTIEKKEQIVTTTKSKTSFKNILLLIVLAATFGFLAGAWFSYWSFSGINAMQTITQAPPDEAVETIVPAEIDPKISDESLVKEKPEKTYQVKNGDSLFQVAEELCGDSTKWKKFVMSNETLVGRKDYLLNASEILVIPSECQNI